MFTVAQAAEYLGVCGESVRRAYRRYEDQQAGKAGGPPGLRGIKDRLAVGSPLRFTQADLDAYRQSRVG